MTTNHSKLSHFALMSIEDNILTEINLEELIKDCQNKIAITTLSQVAAFTRRMQPLYTLYSKFILLSNALRNLKVNFTVEK